MTAFVVPYEQGSVEVPPGPQHDLSETLPVVYEPDLERAVIGLLLYSQPAQDQCTRQLSEEHFHDQRCAAVWRASRRVGFVDSFVLAKEAAVQRSWLLECLLIGQVTGNTAVYIDELSELLWRRKAGDLGQQLHDQAAGGDENAVTDVLADVATLRQRFTVVGPPTHVSELASNDTQDWLVPGVLERGDRIMLTGAEGRGKSEYMRQFAVRVAMGWHPFLEQRCRPLTVLMVDLENREAKAAVRLRRLLSIARERVDTEPRLWCEFRPQGMNLLDASDRRWLDVKLEAVSPDLLVFGSLYRAYRGSDRQGKHTEEAAEKVAAALDDLRVAHDCALMIEAHAGHGEGGDRTGWRPIGASLWLRWPEQGIGMKPVSNNEVELVPWRGSRDRSVEWPKRLREGSSWPWEVAE